MYEPSYVDSVNCPEFAFIYRLSDPRTGLVRYIGCCKNPLTTIRRHSSPGGKYQPKLKAWIRELRQEGLRPQFKLLQMIQYRESHQLETSYIRSFEESAPGQLLNCTQKMTVMEGILKSAFRRIRKRKKEPRASRARILATP